MKEVKDVKVVKKTGVCSFENHREMSALLH
jgi:hypothetical protein